jgi:translation initiation factor 2 alpha subunit (eIF-2alpha)
MKVFAIALIAAVLCTPVYGSAQSATSRPSDIQIELAKENKFVVKVMNVFNKSGNKISGLKNLDSFSSEKKLFVFKTGKGKLRRISDSEIQKIAFARVRQGVLTGKPKSLRVIAWNGAMKNFDLAYRDVKIKDGYLFLDRNEYAKHFDASDVLSSNSNEWSNKFNQYWAKVKRESPEVFSTDFAFQDGRAGMSRKLAAAYCRTCVKIEILNMQIDPAAETIRLRCKEVFYDKWNESK